MSVPFLRCESFPYISRRADWFPCALFPFHSPCTPLVFMFVPFMSLSVPLCFRFISRCFPVMSTSYFLPSFPCTSLHFPFAPQYFPQKKHVFYTFFSAFSQRGRPKTQSFPRFSAKGGRKPKPPKEPAGGIELGPLFCLVERHQIAVWYEGPPPTYPTYQNVGGGGGKGGGYPLSSSKYPTRRAMSADFCGIWAQVVGSEEVARAHARKQDGPTCSLCLVVFFGLRCALEAGYALQSFLLNGIYQVLLSSFCFPCRRWQWLSLGKS